MYDKYAWRRGMCRCYLLLWLTFIEQLTICSALCKCFSWIIPINPGTYLDKSFLYSNFTDKNNSRDIINMPKV